MTRHNSKREPIPSHVLKTAFCELDDLGVKCKKVILHLIALDGIVLRPNKSYTLAEIEAALLAIFGETVTPALMAKIENGVRAQYHIVMH